jgi:hypothetical protein
LEQFQERLTADLVRVLNLAILGWHRWRVATTSLFLAQACRALRSRWGEDALTATTLGTLALFGRVHDRTLELYYRDQSLDQVLDEALRTRRPATELTPTVDRIMLASRVLHHLKRTHAIDETLAMGLERVAAALDELVTANPVVHKESEQEKVQTVAIAYDLLMGIEQGGLRALCLYLLGPLPLETLAQRILSLPVSGAL